MTPQNPSLTQVLTAAKARCQPLIIWLEGKLIFSSTCWGILLRMQRLAPYPALSLCVLPDQLSVELSDPILQGTLSILCITQSMHVLYYPCFCFTELILQYPWVTGSSQHSHPTTIFVSSSFPSNLWKSRFVYILGLGSAPAGNLRLMFGSRSHIAI